MEQVNETINPAQSPENTVPPAGTGYPATGMGFEATTPEQYSARIARTLNRSGTGVEQPGRQINWGHIDVDPRAVTFDWEKYRASLAQQPENAPPAKAPETAMDWTGVHGPGWIPGDDADTNEQAKGPYRTQAQARQAGAAVIPKRLALITAKEYQKALTPVKNNTAYLQPLFEEVAKRLTYSDGKFYYDGNEMTDTELEEQFDNSEEIANNIDVFLLLAIYSIALGEIQRVTAEMSTQDILALINDERFLMFPIVIYMPEFMTRLGLKGNVNKQNIKAMADKILSYNSITGRIKCRRGFQNLPFMLSTGLNPDTNTLTLTSPYMNKLVVKVFDASIERVEGKTGKRPRLKKNGQPYMNPCYSRLIKTSINKVQNERAKAIVKIVIELVETSGSRTPHIKARKIVNQIKDLKAICESKEISTSDKNKRLRRAFGTAWELLETKTRLTKYYPGIQIPKTIPTMGNMDDLTFIFANNGKVTPANDDEDDDD